jgi:CheY-like chemotaxis protein
MEAIDNGQRGLERVLSQDYALVILDLMLSGMKRLDVPRHPRTQPWQVRCEQNRQCAHGGRLLLKSRLVSTNAVGTHSTV